MSDSNAFFLNAHEAMLRSGVDVGAIYRRIGVDPQKLLRPGVRLPHHYQMGFWKAVEEVTKDPEIGLHLCPFLSPFAGETLTHLFVTSPTLGAGLKRAGRYLRLLTDHLSVRIETDPSSPDAALTGVLGDEHTPRHTEITFLYAALQMIRLASGGLISFNRIELRCTPGSSPDEFAHIFGCPVSFDARETRCYFPRRMLDLPLPHADPEMAVAQETLAQRRMRKVLKHDRVDEVRRVIAAQLESEPCSLKGVAARLGRSPRSLRKELLDAETSFNQILTEERQSLAKRLLAKTTEPVEMIARLTGFSERSAFFRAFKKWTGMTPTEYRNSRRAAMKAVVGPEQEQ